VFPGTRALDEQARLVVMNEREAMAKYVLAGDIGGTNTNLAIYARHGARNLSLVREASFPSRRYGALEEVVGEFLSTGSEAIEAAAFGIAGPLSGGVLVPTNLPWRAVEAAGLAQEIGCERVRLMNDLATTGYGALFLPPDEFRTLNEGVPRPGHAAVIAAGTGLGQAMLFWDGSRYLPSASEGGHADFAPRNPLEIGLLEFLLERFERVSYERVLSGPGLVNIFRFLDEGLKRPVEPPVRERFESEDPAAVIGSAALSGNCRTCEEAVDIFVGVYGSQAANLALTLMATGGVYIGGGIVTKILPKMTTGRFLDSFKAKQPLAHLVAEIPVRVILNPKASQIGAAHAAAELALE
jgi:glucokinase